MYRIHPIRCGTLTLPKDATTYLTDRDVEITFPVYAFLLSPTTDDDPTVLVDAGVRSSDSAYMRRNGREVGPPGGGPEPLLSGLAERGVTPDAVDSLVLTHLHHDHVANVSRFPDAELLVQRAEWEAARDPAPILAGALVEEDIEAVEAADPTLLDGGYRLHRGLELLPAPGHSEGMQAVVVRTGGGPHALIGDLAYTQHNLNPGLSSIPDATGERIETTPVDADYLPPGFHVDVRACYWSVRRLRERVGETGVLLGSHDAEMAEVYPRNRTQGQG